MTYQLRVALLAGTLAQGGAEKQLAYTVRALLQCGANVRLYATTRGEHWEPLIQSIGVPVVCVGSWTNPLARLSALAIELRRFRPHVIQSVHSYMNLYAGLVGRILNVPSLGAMRTSFRRCAQANGVWARFLIKAPTMLVANSEAVVDELAQAQMAQDRILLLPNVIDLREYIVADTFNAWLTERREAAPTAMFVGRLIPVKRLDRFVNAVSQACKVFPTMKALIVGDGPERARMEQLVEATKLPAGRIEFLGQVDDVRAVLSNGDMLVLSSDDEGSPNVILEAMAARLPVITTPVGDASVMVQDGINGYVVPCERVDVIAERMIRLAESPSLRFRLGSAGRMWVERNGDAKNLPGRLMEIYREAARRVNDARLLRLLPTSQPNDPPWESGMCAGA